ncbi:MarR family [Mycobacteroides abscessus subsp. abscessus]|uniref:helix-turn-helix domain-containing protein n=1 Tax=Mycobacteroides abscessus TaxID=36809 RepID=UPI0009259F9C|nr:helix-turn-helix domain-containing protein [Mycobacteroides abscessus]SHT43657.1 MarR family [Mycobacteroides abscessus subsp. abscessus]SLK74634.1 MarR family [Mycobacteroides abscessus subsp. abscessus]
MGTIDRFEYLRLATNHGTKGKDAWSTLKPNELGVLVAVWNYANWNTGEAYPSVKRLAAELGVNQSTISRTLKRLVEAGWLEQKSAGSSASKDAAVYVLTIPPKGCVSATVESEQGCATATEGCASATVTVASEQPKGCASANQLNQPTKPLEQNQETKPADSCVSNASARDGDHIFQHLDEWSHNHTVPLIEAEENPIYEHDCMEYQGEAEAYA